MSISKETTVINDPDKTIDFNHLIICPGHAIPSYDGNVLAEMYDEKNWVGLFGYGPGSKEQELYIKHIEVAVDEASKDPHAMLVFSGGYTRAPNLFHQPQFVNCGDYYEITQTPTKVFSEARGYYNVARLLADRFKPDLNNRIRLEEFARDSYENCLNALSLFKSETGKIPEKVSVCGFIFKAGRYDFHIEMIKQKYGIGFEFKYLGVNNSPNKPPELAILPKSLKGESATLDAFNLDPHGTGTELMSKKLTRDFLPNRTLPFTLLQ